MRKTRYGLLIGRIAKSTLAAAGATILVLWAWNSSIPELFGLPEMQFKHALGLVILTAAAGWLLALPQHARPREHRTGDEARQS